MLHDADAIVVGAGLCGSWAAKTLTAGGMKVALVDAGPIVPASAFLVDSQASVFNPRYHLFRLKLLLRGESQLALNKFVHSQTNKLFLDRNQHPYLTPSARDFSWLRVRAVGGRGHLWGRVMLRMTDRELSKPGFEWPITYSELDPFYSEVESLMELGGQASHTSQVPDGSYIQHRSLHPLEEKFSESIAKRWPFRKAVVNHVAGYEPGPLSPMLKAAMATGGLSIFPDRVATALLLDGPKGAVSGIVAQSNCGREMFRAPFVILAASAFESVRLLLNSRSTRFPKGVGNCQDYVGTRVLEHIGANFFGQLPKRLRSKHPAYGHNPFKLNEEPHGFYIPPFERFEKRREKLACEFGVQGTISSDTGLFYLGAFGETTPSDANCVRIDPTQLDRYGVPLASIDFSWSSEDLAMWRTARQSLREMVTAFCQDYGIDLKDPLSNRFYRKITASEEVTPLPGSNHECGGARMGTDPTNSVVDPYNRVWEAPNVLICDASCFPSIPHQNPTLTTMALALRASRRLLAGA